ncbi:hypothetical protein BKA81DRAFT_82881 [Phyllosticta paracitricarpa]
MHLSTCVIFVSCVSFVSLDFPHKRHSFMTLTQDCMVVSITCLSFLIYDCFSRLHTRHLLRPRMMQREQEKGPAGQPHQWMLV